MRIHVTCAPFSGSQRQALVFIAALTQSDCGLQAILDSNAVGHCLSGFIDTKCRFVYLK